MIDSTLNKDDWRSKIDSPIPENKQIDGTPENWYTQYWFNCASQELSANLDGYEFHKICDYNFKDDETVYTGHLLDFY